MKALTIGDSHLLYTILEFTVARSSCELEELAVLSGWLLKSCVAANRQGTGCHHAAFFSRNFCIEICIFRRTLSR
jgi:hypothetical protein